MQDLLPLRSVDDDEPEVAAHLFFAIEELEVLLEGRLLLCLVQDVLDNLLVGSENFLLLLDVARVSEDCLVV